MRVVREKIYAFGFLRLGEEPVVLSTTSYDPFGFPLPYQPAASASYPYSFNGQLKDPKLGTGHTTARFWEYDPRLGRRWNVDPVTYAWQSPYACFNNNPIAFTDHLHILRQTPKIAYEYS